jgi:hypothetical protein
MRFPEQLEQVLQQLPLRELRVRIVNPDAFQCIVVLVSPDFEAMDEADRQSLVWGHLSKAFTWEELSQIEFIFTDSPAERLAAEASSG